ncbi:MAG TPA: sigma-70 family RNA polymerase sigma factor [Steroidobacter sp.]
MPEDQFLNRVIELLPALRAFGRSLCGDPARADDLVQDTFLKAWLNQSQFRLDSNLKAWLFTILANSYYSELRRRRYEIEDADDIYAERLTVTANFDGELQLDELNRALDRLPRTQKEALLLACAGGLPYGRVADVCGVAIGTVKSRIARGRAELIDRMGDSWMSADVPPPHARDARH